VSSKAIPQAATAAKPADPKKSSAPITFLLVLGIVSLLAVSLLFDERHRGLFFLVLSACVVGLSLSAVWRMIDAIFGLSADAKNPNDSRAVRARRELLAKKETTLRIINELNFDHQLGRISKEDYDTLLPPLQREYAQLNRQLEEEQQVLRGSVERELERRLVSEGLAPGKPSDEAEEGRSGKKGKRDNKRASQAKTESEAATVPCPSCAKPIDPDSAFCKHCGHKMSAQS
jgi:hypothetical protein